MCRNAEQIADAANLQVDWCVGRGHGREKIEDCIDVMNQEYDGLRCGSRRRKKARRSCRPGLDVPRGDRAFVGTDSHPDLQEKRPAGWLSVD